VYIQIYKIEGISYTKQLVNSIFPNYTAK